jgi:hypothetical protein
MAACPGPDSLALGGVTLRSDRETTLYRSSGDGIVTAMVTALDGSFVATTDLGFGLIPIAIRAEFADPAIPDVATVHDLTTDDLAAALPPVPGQTAVLTAMVTETASGLSDPVTIRIAAGPATGAIRIGDCPLTGLPVELIFERPGLSWRQDMVWLPDIGIAYLARRQIGDFPEETFTPQDIAAQ